MGSAGRVTGETLEVALPICYNDTYNRCMEVAVSPGQEFIEWALVWLCRKKVVEIEERL